MNSYSLDYIDDLYVQYVRDPSSVSATWRTYFEQFLLVNGISATAEQAKSQVSAGTVQRSANGSTAPSKGSVVANQVATSQGTINSEQAIWLSRIQDRVNNLVREYRVRGHLTANLDPLGFPRPDSPNLSPEVHGLSKDDMNRPFDASFLEDVMGETLDAILTRLRNTYCRSIGAQFMHIDRRTIRDWLQRRMETTENRLELSHDVQRRIYVRLADASIFEEFVRRKFVGAKTFSLEGAESLIPMLDLALEKAGQHNVKEVVMGMAHRGRLNVMANILKKRALNIFWSFDDPTPEMNRGGGDVRYHLGYSSDWKTASGDNIHISLCFNPSHLEFVNTVAQGRTRCKQDRHGDVDRREVMTILIHGDAAFAGEGVVQETLNLSELAGYRTGGTLHIVINNQVGFTTEPSEGRSTTYATDIAKMLQIPIFHVNGEDPEAVAQVVSLAMDFRKEFHRDVVIDLYAFRRWGHNEGDEPRFTQPRMYAEIDRRDSVRQQYLNQLLKLGKITAEEAEEIQRERTEKLESEFEATKHVKFVPDTQTLAANWSQYFGGLEPSEETDTTVDVKVLGGLLDSLTRLPAGFAANKKLKRPMAHRRDMAEGKTSLDWASAEAAAFASLLTAGHPIRMTGQDCERGTFSQRHAVLHDTKTGEKYTPLKNLSPDQAPLELYNSPLSEAGVLGFEYGYSLDNPDGLTLWEAQFGDFWNCAQVIVDQFIASAEDKWNRLSGLVMLLPHGFEGQGPEHCSARVERFLAMSAEHNIQVVQPTTPAQYFHLLRRQVLRKWRKPLVVLTPKSLLRHPKCISPLHILAGGSFKKILPDRKVKLADAKRLIMCTGKVYYDLLAARTEKEIKDIAIMRIEQLYPLTTDEVMSTLKDLPEGSELVWVQEEPTNMGAWPYLKLNFYDEWAKRFKVHRVSRVESASPSTGSLAAHKLEQADLIAEALGDLG
ncbi:2-oxoglutarate dehydrogenase E1 component [Rubripirellula amarantea]|uniref:2-oxoglutarate dehydrogenase E1 component n=1 Tax=Rubripirellula amarantea TaxID=2527999 RepID=A0A5C5WT17_9BACT|nr:2-oxoglutarate dehydrogenase E1 component [Rubripirellula amarantea]MDA8744463.1 2-oxoglutarate dehydrogenase E1 component [Rubripirellula amarantea]TWT53309.1 2-oxoglutarate dehydrogenase E1 component [Rubripirellula amarantea]